MSFVVAGIAVGAVGAGGGIAKMIGAKKARKAAEGKAEAARAEMDRRRAEYEQLDMSNPYANFQNQMAENVYEDLTVNKQQAEFERSQQEQQRANIMDRLAGSAGGSGIAALAQQMANQGSVDARRSAASIGAQESAQQKLKAEGELIVQRGEQAAQQKRVEGDIMSREWEKTRTQTLMGMAQQETAAHQQAAAQAQAQQTAAWGDIAGGVTAGITMGMTDKIAAAGAGALGGLGDLDLSSLDPTTLAKIKELASKSK